VSPWPAPSPVASHPALKVLSSQFVGPSVGSRTPNTGSAAAASSRHRTPLHHGCAGRRVSRNDVRLSGSHCGHAGRWVGSADVGPSNRLAALAQARQPSSLIVPVLAVIGSRSPTIGFGRCLALWHGSLQQLRRHLCHRLVQLLGRSRAAPR
jgi:hypothetical protein